MAHIVRLVGIILVLVVSSAWAKEQDKKSFSEWHLRDLYYHDASGTIVRLDLASKLYVRFKRNDTTKEERTSLLAEFSPIAVKEVSGDASGILVEFHPSMNTLELLTIANKIAGLDVAQVHPVFFVDNIEAVIDGIAVEPKIVLTPNRLLERMRKYGDFSSRQAFFENGAMIFLVDDVKPPLNILVLTNLVQNDSWIRRAYPRFRFLHDPIIASIVVEPVSGTIGETRTATFTVKIFDPSIMLALDRLPEFGRGLFMPIQGIPALPARIRYPSGYLFELVGDPVRTPVRQEKRSRTYMTSWKFKHYALGEWTIPSQPVPYAKKGVDEEIKSSGFTLVVNSQIGNLKITDMPAPLTLFHPREKPMVTPELALPSIPSYWFDRWLPNATRVMPYMRLTSFLFGISAVACVLMIVLQVFSRRVDRSDALHALRLRISYLLKEGAERVSYNIFSEALSLILTSVFPHLSSNPVWEEIKDDTVIRQELDDETIELLEVTFSELGRRHAREFVPGENMAVELERDIRQIWVVIEHIWVLRKKAA